MKPLRLVAATLAVLLACEPALMAAGSVRVVPARTGAYSPLPVPALPASVAGAVAVPFQAGPEAAIAPEDLHVSPEVLAAETGARFDLSQARPRSVSVDAAAAAGPAPTLSRSSSKPKKIWRDPAKTVEISGVVMTGAASALAVALFGWLAVPGIFVAWKLAQRPRPDYRFKMSRSAKSRKQGKTG